MPKSHWEELIERKPEHTQWFINKFETMKAEGKDILREARFIDALTPPRSRILDAGCGYGRHSAHLVAQGHTVVGIDVDPGLIAHAQENIPGGTFICSNLDSFEIPADVTNEFDVIFLAGNVVTFFHPTTRVAILSRLTNHLAEDGRLAIGFGSGRGYEYADFFEDVEQAGLRVDTVFSTWDMRPFQDGDTFMVTLLSRQTELAFRPISLAEHRKLTLDKPRTGRTLPLSRPRSN